MMACYLLLHHLGAMLLNSPKLAVRIAVEHPSNYQSLVMSMRQCAWCAGVL